MLTTVVIGTVSVQGNFVKRLASGMVIVRVGEQLFTGRPVSSAQAA